MIEAITRVYLPASPVPDCGIESLPRLQGELAAEGGRPAQQGQGGHLGEAKRSNLNLDNWHLEVPVTQGRHTLTVLGSAWQTLALPVST